MFLLSDSLDHNCRVLYGTDNMYSLWSQCVYYSGKFF